MGKVDAFEVEGIEVWFNSVDHPPPHFHARRRGEWEIRVLFLLCTKRDLRFTKKWGRKDPTANHRDAILEKVLVHRTALLLEWEKKVRTSP